MFAHYRFFPQAQFVLIHSLITGVHFRRPVTQRGYWIRVYALLCKICVIQTASLLPLQTGRFPSGIRVVLIRKALGKPAPLYLNLLRSAFAITLWETKTGRYRLTATPESYHLFSVLPVPTSNEGASITLTHPSPSGTNA